MEVTETDGLNGGKLLATGDGRYYYIDKYNRDRTITYVKCRTRACRGTGKVVREGDVGQVFRGLLEHSVGCEPDDLFPQTMRLRRTILERCFEDIGSSLTAIFNEECNR